MKRNLSASFALALLLLVLAACSGPGAPSGGNACPGPAQFDHAGCTFDDAGTTFGP
ncbi:branched-chain amino acid ABC transporter substrate-binding protein [Oceanithermus desulfurans]